MLLSTTLLMTPPVDPTLTTPQSCAGGLPTAKHTETPKYTIMGQLTLIPMRVTEHGITFQAEDRATLSNCLVFCDALMLRDFNITGVKKSSTWVENKAKTKYAAFKAANAITVQGAALLPWDNGKWTTKEESHTDANGQKVVTKPAEKIYGLVPA